MGVSVPVRARAIPAALAMPLLLFLAVPVVMLVARTTPGEVVGELGDRETVQAIVLSLGTSTASLLVSIGFGIPLAYWLAHTRSRFAPVIETLVDLPTVLPPSVAGVALLLALGRTGPIGSWLGSMGVELAFTTAAVVLAQVFVASPYFVRAARAGFASVDTAQREAAINLGASRWVEFRAVLAPQAAPSLGAGAAMCWSRAVGEFGATIIFAGNLPGRTQTMPLAVYTALESDREVAIALSILLLAVSIGVLVALRGHYLRGATA